MFSMDSRKKLVWKEGYEMKICMLEPLAVDRDFIEELAAPLRKQGHECVFCTEKVDAETAAGLDADVFIIANSPLSGEVIRANTRLKFISVAFTGVDHVDLKTCEERGIRLKNAQGYCTDAVAELTFGHILALLRNILPCDEAARHSGTKEGLVGRELRGKTVGVVETGAIGVRVAQIASVFGCRVLGYSRSRRQEALEAGVEYVPLETLLEESDIVTLHTPLTEETRGLIGKEQLARMKPSALLINMARGAVVDSAALADALNEGRLAGAGIDVFETEPPLPAEHPLLRAKNVLLTPHVAFASEESMKRRAQIVFRNIEEWFASLSETA